MSCLREAIRIHQEQPTIDNSVLFTFDKFVIYHNLVIQFTLISIPYKHLLLVVIFAHFQLVTTF